jgi:uncharacterized protein with von Willebrand factor type A (vWA) domain
MATWTRRVFSDTGLTQVPPGPHLAKLQSRIGGGAVVLMIDVSGSMDGTPILEAVRGAKQFVAEAVEARYKVSVMLWNTVIVAVTRLSDDETDAIALLNRTHSAYGGNALDGPLFESHTMLNEYDGDRVVALFGDGDLTPKDRVLEKVAVMKRDNIRFVTRGLGSYAATEFGQISDEDPQTARVETVAQLADGIASMASSLKARG